MLRGEIVTGRLVWLAVVRHYEDLRDGAARGLVFSPAHARHVIDFIERFFLHVKGRLAGQPILLDGWQKFWTALLYGWRRAVPNAVDADGHLVPGPRRFRRAYKRIARKNGKSTWKGPEGVYALAFSGERGPEVYAVATTRAQALTVYQPAFVNVKRWRRESPGAARSFKVTEGKNQECIQLLSSTAPGVYEPLPANAENLDGKNPSVVIYDEVHAAPTADVWNVMETALGAREEPLLQAITTSGYNLDGVDTDLRNYGVQVLENATQDDDFLAVIYELDEDDDPFEEKNWPKANPGLGTVKFWEYMRGMAAKARTLPSMRVNFLTKDLNRSGVSGEGWFDIDVWDKGGKRKFTWEDLRGRRCYGGLDLASTTDLVALAFVFPPEDDDPAGEWVVLVFFWCPQDKIDTQEAADRAKYKLWQKQGWLTGTPGNVTDYGPVREKLLWACQNFDVVEVGFDRWNAQQLANELQEAGVPLVEVPQNTGGMYPGSKALEILVYSKRLQHAGNPVLRYCAGNVVLLFDTNDNFRPDKRKSKPNGRIDGVVATVMALSRAVATSGERPIEDFLNAPITT